MIKKFSQVIEKLMDLFIDKMMDRFMSEVLEQGKPENERKENLVKVLLQDKDIELIFHIVSGTDLLNAGVHPMMHRSKGDELDEEEKELLAERFLLDARQLLCECSNSPKILPHYVKAEPNQFSINELDDKQVMYILHLICPFENSNFYRANPGAINMMASDCLEEHYIRADRQETLINSFATYAKCTGKTLEDILNMSHDKIVRVGEMSNVIIETAPKKKNKGNSDV